MIQTLTPGARSTRPSHGIMFSYSVSAEKIIYTILNSNFSFCDILVQGASTVIIVNVRE